MKNNFERKMQVRQYFCPIQGKFYRFCKRTPNATPEMAAPEITAITVARPPHELANQLKALSKTKKKKKGKTPAI